LRKEHVTTSTPRQRDDAGTDALGPDPGDLDGNHASEDVDSADGSGVIRRNRRWLIPRVSASGWCIRAAVGGWIAWLAAAATLAAGLQAWGSAPLTYCLSAQVFLAIAGLRLMRMKTEALRKRIDDARRREQRLRRVLRGSPAVHWVSGRGPGRMFLNGRWTELTGRAARHANGPGWVERIHPEDRHRVEAALNRAVDDETPFSLRYRVRMQGDDYAWVQDSASPRPATSEEPAGFVGVIVELDGTTDAVEPRTDEHSPNSNAAQDFADLEDEAAASLFREHPGCPGALLGKALRGGEDEGRENDVVEQRDHRRVPQEMLQSNLGDVLDLSVGGMRIRHVGAHPPEGSLDVEIRADHECLRLRGEVAWTARVGKRRHEVGVRFVDVTPDIEEQLSRISMDHRYRLSFNAA